MPADPWSRFGVAVRDARDELGLSHRDAALNAGMSPTTWMKCEHGNHVSSAVIRKVERALGWPAGTADSIIYEGSDIEERLADYERRVALLEKRALAAIETLASAAAQQIAAAADDTPPARRR